ncbi:hypothetical protein [Amycolatopsis minnesotensis]|uniref:Uncharacterized protein n=1 Tax=Amycolatopsis minnesotensis TaxID=337894 RepID=A0ABP5C7L6_9PSEU
MTRSPTSAAVPGRAVAELGRLGMRAVVHARADAIAHPRAVWRYRNLLLDNGFSAVRSEVRPAVERGPHHGVDVVADDLR